MGSRMRASRFGLVGLLSRPGDSNSREATGGRLETPAGPSPERPRGEGSAYPGSAGIRKSTSTPPFAPDDFLFQASGVRRAGAKKAVAAGNRNFRARRSPTCGSRAAAGGGRTRGGAAPGFEQK